MKETKYKNISADRVGCIHIHSEGERAGNKESNRGLHGYR